MFKVMIHQEWTTRDKRTKEYEITERDFEFITRTEKVFELIGRFFMKYGMPNDHKTDTGCYLIEFYKELPDEGYISASIYFEKTNVKNEKEPKVTKEVVPVKEHDLIEALLSAEAIRR